jgi:hypothetical protein
MLGSAVTDLVLKPPSGMARAASPSQQPDPAAVVVGYLNFSSGAFDPAAWRALSELYASQEPAAGGSVVERPETAARVAERLGSRLRELESTQPAFRDARQARLMLGLLFDRLLPAYRQFHADLLEHQPPGGIERPFFVMAAARALLSEAAGDLGAADEGADRLVAAAIDRLDDYVGWRPVAVLENGRLSAPYPHERVGPIPLFVAGAGVAHGRYAGLVAGAIDILSAAPAELLLQADFDLAALEELAIDPRAFDFLHPAASRPNYLFGLWDPARIDEQGRYRRMVVQQATLDGVLSWPSVATEAAEPGRRAELQLEAAAVLAGVMLMASGLCGHGPGAAQAALGLGDLLPRIARYRDAFYRWLIGQLPPSHASRLESEAATFRQAFGGVRRHINATLASRRAAQVEHVSLAAIMARLGRAAAAEQLASEVPAASARMFARITSLCVAARQALWRRGDAAAAITELDQAVDLLFRAVGCGAAVDPWNILGLAGQFPLHEPGGESLPDPRVEDLVNVTSTILDGYAAAWRQAGLAGNRDVASAAAAALEKLAGWWDRHASTTVEGVPHLSGRECVESGREVLEALARRKALPVGTPPPGFWRQAVAGFSSPRSHAQAAEALLEEGDLDGAAGLLVHWASLLEGEAVERTGPVWLTAAAAWLGRSLADLSLSGRQRVRRFLELVEANTSGIVDLLEAAAVGREPGRDLDAFQPDDDDEQAEGEERVAAAYESMVWRDSTDDGVDGGMLDVEGPQPGSTGGVGAIEDAAEFLAGVLRLFQGAVTAWCAADAAARGPRPAEETDSVVGWRHTIRRLERTLVRAAGVVAARDAEPPPGMSATEFDRLRWQRDAATERLIDAAVVAGETRLVLSTWIQAGRRLRSPETGSGRGSASRLLAAAIAGDAEAVSRWLPIVREQLAGKPVLYVPLSRGGRPERIVRARGRERLLERLAAVLPRVGLVEETIGIVQLAKALESRRPPGGASVSEFDRVFEAATTALTERIVVSGSAADASGREPTPSEITARILDGLAQLVPRLLETWMTHARQLRLSVLERVRDDRGFAATREFIERYGAGLFTQQLLGPASLRGMLRGGVRHYLERLVDREANEPLLEGESGPRPELLVADIASGALPIRQAAARIRLVLESIAENHAEYRDWNSTTTQSDRGELLHILLDHLRLKAEYDRIAWTLRPVNMAHRVLARRGATDAAAAWRQRMQEETVDTAKGIVARLDALEAAWGVRLASISDRVRRPFTMALEQDELESLVGPAVGELMTAWPEGAGAALEAKARLFLGVASGSGVEVPDWLDRLTSLVDVAIDRADLSGGQAGPTALPESFAAVVPWRPVPWDSLRAELEG